VTFNATCLGLIRITARGWFLLPPKYRVIRNKNVFNKDEMSIQRGTDLYENNSIETVLLVVTDH
jgi:hypothetical protein